MSTATVTAPGKDELTVVVADPDGQEEARFRVSPTTQVRELAEMAKVSLGLPPDIDWDLRSDASSRLLPEDDQLGDVAKDRETDLRLTMQPDAGLG